MDETKTTRFFAGILMVIGDVYILFGLHQNIIEFIIAGTLAFVLTLFLWAMTKERNDS